MKYKIPSVSWYNSQDIILIDLLHYFKHCLDNQNTNPYLISHSNVFLPFKKLFNIIKSEII